MAKSRRKSNNNNSSTRKIYKLVAIARIITLALNIGIKLIFRKGFGDDNRKLYSISLILLSKKTRKVL